MLTAEQVNYFETFGFLVFRKLFSPAEVEMICREANDAWKSELGHPPTDTEAVSLDNFIEKRPPLTQLVIDDRIYVPIQQLLGKDFIWSGSEGNRGFHPGDNAHHWHADRPGRGELNYTRIKIMIYLDPMRKDEGAFRVIPGSHRLPLHEDLEPFQLAHSEKQPKFFGLDGKDVPCYAAETDPGDVVFFTQSLFHAVYGKQGERRYIALKFAARPRSKEHIASLNKWSNYAFEPHETLCNSPNPRLSQMVAGLAELGASTRKT